MNQKQMKFTQRFRPFSGRMYSLNIAPNKEETVFQISIVGVIDVGELRLGVHKSSEVGGYAVTESLTGARIHSLTHCSITEAIDQAEKVFKERGYGKVLARVQEFREAHKDLEEVNRDFSTLALQLLGYE